MGEAVEFQLAPIQVPSSAEAFAEQLRSRILSGEITPGSTLPSERALMEQSQLSRAIVREGLRELRHQGLISTRRGSTGGSVVSRPSREDLTEAIDLFALAHGIGPEGPLLRETREVVEPWCAALAAARRSESDLERIDACHLAAVERIRDIDAYSAAAADWHLAVAAASQNSLLSALLSIRLDGQMIAARKARNSTVKRRRESLEVHLAIAEAIRERRPREAHDLMAHHCSDGKNLLIDRLEQEAARRRGQ